MLQMKQKIIEMVGLKKLFNTYKSKRQFVKDFNSVPITSNGNNKTLV